MIHVFEALGSYLALDVESGALHVLDELAYDALRAWPGGEAAVREALAGRCAPEEAGELIDEIRALVAQGAMDAQAPHVDAAPSADPVIKAMCLHAAHDCNLRCRYCFAGTGDFCGERSLLPLDTGKRALDFLIAHSGDRRNLEVDFFGGEPMLNLKVVRQLVAYGRSLESGGKRFKFTMTTNGIGLNDEVIDFLGREMDNVVISLDGRKSVHDAMRPMAGGGGSYDRILAGAQALARAREQQRYYVRGTFTRDNLDFAQDVLSLADAGFEQISVEPVVLEADSPYALLPEHLPGILAEYETLAKAYVERRRSGRWFNFFHFMIDLGNGPCLKKRLTGCGAGNEYIAVTPEGDIYPCHQFVGREGFRMGSVLDGTFDRGIQARFAANHVLSKPTCSSCWAKYHCSGGCAANAHRFHGDISQPYDMECQMERKRLECAMAIHAIERGNAS